MPVASVIDSLPTILERLHAKFPGARYELNWENPVQLLVATILAAQCTDERVNQVTSTLFVKYTDARAYADADIAVLEEDLKPTGFYREKAKKVQGACKALVERYGGQVPPSMEEMLTLPGVARKTANVVLNNAFQLPTGVIVDTHVQRVSQRMGLTDQKKPEKIELDLMNMVPKEEWIFFGPAVVLHGRYTCTFHKPACDGCQFADLCPKLGVGEDQDEAGEDAPQSDEDTPIMATKKTPKAKKTKASPAKPAATALAPKSNVPSLRDQLPADWREVLKDEFDKPYFKKLEEFVAADRLAGPVYPPAEEVFSAFQATPFAKVKVLLLGQDPYHGAGEAHGMCFSVKPGVKIPPSLANMYKEMQDDVGCAPAAHGNLTAWAEQGVFLLNTVLTVRANSANSHKDQGWETFTDAVIKAISGRSAPVVFLLWGNKAQAKDALIDKSRHRVLKAGHPSPLSAKSFFGSKPFSSANWALQELGQGAINWQLPGDPATKVAALPAAKPAPVAKPAIVAEPMPALIPLTPHSPSEPTALERMLPADWRKALESELRKPSFRQLDQFLATERRSATVCPEECFVFAALHETPVDRVRVVFFGQEPPCQSDVADGLAFSIRDGVELSETQKAMTRELRRDLGYRLPVSGSLRPWARQGVLLLNSLLTVREGRPGSHKSSGWEAFTDGILRVLSDRPSRIVFVLLGAQAAKKKGLIDETRHTIVLGDHPGQSPDDFHGSGLFSRINHALGECGWSSVYWQLDYA